MADIYKKEPTKLVNKIVTLEQAIASHVKAGMGIYIHNAGAATYEIVRQFQGKEPSFTVMMTLLGGPPVLSLIHCGLAKRLIFTTCAEFAPRPTMSPVIERVYGQKSIQFENWSVLSFTQALMAGALNLPFMPTLSVTGSSLADENRHSFTVIDDPFGQRKIGLVKRLNPDIALVHGWASDPYGNTILGPFGECWGAKASARGCIVTVERIVSPEFLRSYSTFAKIPGYLVNAVCVAPFGAHPDGTGGDDIYQFEEYSEESYARDVDFRKEFHLASQEPNKLNKWVKEWILDCKTHDDYLNKLGMHRLNKLKSKTNDVIKQSRPTAETSDLNKRQQPSGLEYQMVAAYRRIKAIMIERGYKSIFAGTGLAALASWAAYDDLIGAGHEVNIIGARRGITTSTENTLMITEILDMHGVCVGGINSKCLGVLGAAQIDKNGNINSSKIGNDLYLTGAGGGNDIGSAAQEVVIITRQKQDRFLEAVPYITIPGTKVTTLISDMGIFEKDDSEFILTEYFPERELSTKEEMIKQIADNCGWKLKISPSVKEVPPLTIEELGLLYSLDAKGGYLPS